MNFVSALVVLTLAVAANASVIGLGGWPWGVPTWGPYASTNIISNGPVWAGAPAALLAAHHGAAAVIAAHGPAAVVAAHAPVVAAHAAAIVPGASYVGANRGSVHVAPLPGHAHSVSSINVQPAPGTW